MKSRGQKALINTVVLGIYQFVMLVCGLVLPRYMLVYFGSDYNGIVTAISQFLSFIVILQIGISGSTRFALYKALANDDTLEISGIVNATEKYMRKVGIILIVYIIFLVFALPNIIKTTISPFNVSILVLIVGTSSFAQYFFGITYQILLTADQKQYIYYTIATIAMIMNATVALFLMKMGQNIFVVKSASTFVFATVPIFLLIYVRKRYSIISSVKPNNVGLKGRWDVMWHSLANIVHDNTDLVILTVFTDAKIVSVYTVYYLVINGIYKVLSVFTSSLEAAFGNMIAKDEITAVYKNLEIYEFLMYIFISIVFSCTIVLIVPFVKLYTTGVTDINYVEPIFALIACVSQMFMCIRQPYLTVVQAAGHYKQTKNGAVAEAGINFCLSIILTFKFGLIGVAIGTLVANVFRTVQYICYLRSNIIKRAAQKPLFMILWLLLNMVVITVICNIIINTVNISSWIMWIVAGIVCLSISLLVTISSAALFYSKKLSLARNTIANILIKKKI